MATFYIYVYNVYLIIHTGKVKQKCLVKYDIEKFFHMMESPQFILTYSNIYTQGAM